MSIPPRGRGRGCVITAWMKDPAAVAVATQGRPNGPSSEPPAVPSADVSNIRMEISPVEKLPAVPAEVVTPGDVDSSKTVGAPPQAEEAANSSEKLSEPLSRQKQLGSDRDRAREIERDRNDRGNDRRRDKGSRNPSPSTRSRGFRAHQRSDDSDTDRRRRDSPRKRRMKRRNNSRSSSYPLRNQRERDRSRSRSYRGRPTRHTNRRSSSRSTSTKGSRTRSPSNDMGTCEALCKRLAELRGASSSKKRSLERDFNRLIDQREFYAEDRHGKKISLETYLDQSLCRGKVDIHKRITAKLTSHHSFAIDFEVLPDDSNRIALYECKRGKLTRVYYFKDRDGITSTSNKSSLTEILGFDSCKNIRKYLYKKGVKDQDMHLTLDC